MENIMLKTKLLRFYLNSMQRGISKSIATYTLFLAIVGFLLLGLPQNAKAESDGTLDATFNATQTSGTDGHVSSLAVQPDGKIVVVGGFYYAGSRITKNHVARLNPDGSLDTTFNTGDNPGVVPVVNPNPWRGIYTVALQPDGKIIIGGGFGLARGVSKKGIARLNPDGSLDTSFNIGDNPGTDYRVYSAVVQPDGKIVIGGYFSTARGVTQNGIARLNPDGSLDTTFNTGDNPGVMHTDVREVALQTDGKIIIGGNFTTTRGITQNNIARLNPDGSLDTTFTTGTNGAVHAISLQPNDKILVGGNFTTTNGVLQNRFSRLNPDGSLDTTFNNSPNPGTSGSVSTIAVLPDGKILLGGVLGTFYDSTAYSSYIARLDQNKTDLEVINYTATSNPPTAGQIVTLTAQIAPTGPSVAKQVALTLSLPISTTFVDFVVPESWPYADNWTCDTPPIGAGGNVTCLFPYIRPSLITSFELKVLISPDFANTSFTSTVTVTTTSPDPNLANNTRTITVPVTTICNALLVTAISDDGKGTTCGTFSYALLNASSAVTITFSLSEGNTITFTDSLTVPVKVGLGINGGENGVTFNGNSVSGDGLMLSGGNTLSNLVVRNFGGREIVAANNSNSSTFNRVRVENTP
jgi:uncharacterized delta-60 repeat protein